MCASVVERLVKNEKIWLKICLFGFLEMFVMGSTTTAAREVVLSSTLIGAFEFECERPLNLSSRNGFKYLH